MKEAKHSMLHALHVPDWRRGNPYQSLLGQALERQKIQVSWADFPTGFLALNRLLTRGTNCSVIHLHWVNDLIGPIVWTNNPLKRLLRAVALAIDVMMVRIRGIQVVWTIHNLVSHESINADREIAARRQLAWWCSAVIVHSSSALEKIESTYRTSLGTKARIIPHGNYDGCYQSNEARQEALRSEIGFSERDIVILYFGAIRPYKGVHKLIEAFHSVPGEHLRLVIAGSTRPPSLASELVAAAAKDSRILLRLGFVDDADVAPLYALADVVVVPLERSLTSGSTVLAMTLGKATILPMAARIFDLLDEESGMFYVDEEDLRRLLSHLEKPRLQDMGKAARRRANDLDWDAIGSLVRRLYCASNH